MLKKYYRNSQAFTLVELSIVLVIIGLIISGVLIGQDLIKAAEVRSIISQLDKYNIAVNSFRLKYNALPGDFADAATYLSPNAGVGNGDGVIGDISTIPTDLSLGNNKELAYFFQHLSLANLIEGGFTGDTSKIILNQNFPSIKSNRGGIILYSDSSGINYYHIGLQNNLTGSKIITGDNLTPASAMSIDQKLDDGVPDNGTVQARGGNSLEQNPSTGNQGCVTSASGGKYNVIGNNSGFVCQLRINSM